MPTLLHPKNWSSLELCFSKLYIYILLLSFKDWCETQSAELLREVETQKKSADKAAAATQPWNVAMVVVNQSTTCCAFFSDYDLTCKNKT